MPRLVRDNVDKFFDYGISLDTKTIYLANEVDSEMAMNAIKGLHILDQVKPDLPITIHLDNCGGDEYSGLAVYDYIVDKLQSEVHIEVFGACFSMASWILQAGDKRTMSRHARLMVHRGTLAIDEDNPENIKRWMDQYTKDQVYLENILLDKIKEVNPHFTRNQLNEMLKLDTILNPQEAKQLGLIDSILGEDDV